MADILSQEEIDALLDIVEDDEDTETEKVKDGTYNWYKNRFLNTAINPNMDMLVKFSNDTDTSNSLNIINRVYTTVLNKLDKAEVDPMHILWLTFKMLEMTEDILHTFEKYPGIMTGEEFDAGKEIWKEVKLNINFPELYKTIKEVKTKLALI